MSQDNHQPKELHPSSFIPHPYHTVVVAAVIERGGMFLAHQRPPGGWGAGMWEFPGGKLERGEDPREAVMRECREELGVEVIPTAIDDVLCHAYSDLGSTVLVFIRCCLADGEPEPQCLEGGAVRWLGPDELGTVEWLEADLPFVERLGST